MNSGRALESPTYFVVPGPHESPARFEVSPRSPRSQAVFRPLCQGHLRYGRAKQ